MEGVFDLIGTNYTIKSYYCVDANYGKPSIYQKRIEYSDDTGPINREPYQAHISFEHRSIDHPTKSFILNDLMSLIKDKGYEIIEIHDVFVDPHIRRRGFGSLMFKEFVHDLYYDPCLDDLYNFHNVVVVTTDTSDALSPIELTPEELLKHYNVLNSFYTKLGFMPLIGSSNEDCYVYVYVYNEMGSSFFNDVAGIYEENKKR